MSRKMYSTLKRWIEELETDVEIVSSHEINEEAGSNLFSFGFNQYLLSEWGRDSVQDFLASCADIYKRKCSGSAMVFYSWLDNQAGQIRISAVSESHNKLPFGCKINMTSLEQVVDDIFSNDSGLYTKGALDVWCKNI
ncbi:hypothetical protein ACJJI3_03590 [Microbulbifer sp. ZKSA004]|uniref:hypothetical protein n=1 Tax=Microbulbifer sp. ZKSA004 TaxID=3243389 RepID=UPI00403A65E0